MTDRFRPTASGIEVTLESTELALLERVALLVGSVGAKRLDPAAARLDPAVHPEDDAASTEFVRLGGVEVARGRSADVAAFERTLNGVQTEGSLSLEDAEAWVRTLGTARITLIARSGVEFDDESLAAADRSDPDILLVDYLGFLQEELLAVLLGALPAAGDSG